MSHANRVTGKGTLEGAAQLPAPLQGALMAGDDDNPLFLGGLRPPATDITDAMGAAIATGPSLLHCTLLRSPLAAGGNILEKLEQPSVSRNVCSRPPRQLITWMLPLPQARLYCTAHASMTAASLAAGITSP